MLLEGSDFSTCFFIKNILLLHCECGWWCINMHVRLCKIPIFLFLLHVPDFFLFLFGCHTLFTKAVKDRDTSLARAEYNEGGTTSTLISILFRYFSFLSTRFPVITQNVSIYLTAVVNIVILGQVA